MTGRDNDAEHFLFPFPSIASYQSLWKRKKWQVVTLMVALFIAHRIYSQQKNKSINYIIDGVTAKES